MEYEVEGARPKGKSKTRFVQTVKYCFQDFPGLAKTKFQGFPGLTLIFKDVPGYIHGCMRSKKCTYQISYRCNCITVNKPKCF